MQHETDAASRPVDGTPVPATPGGRISFERLRERSDELELLISGLLVFGLFTVPGRLFDAWVSNTIHADGMAQYAIWFGFAVGVGVSYALAAAFMTHIAIRGYWVALIGLKATFPDGVRWDRLTSMGPVSRGYQRALIGDIGQAIERADRMASILFAMSILMAVTIAGVGVTAIALMVLGSLAGALFGMADRVALIVGVALYAVFLAGTLAMVVCEKMIARRDAAGRPSDGLRRLLLRLLRLYSVLVPQRLIGPMQLTLQSNLNGRAFLVVYGLVIGGAMLIGGLQVINSMKFSLLQGYEVVTEDAVDHGMLGAHYENMRAEHDALLRYPMIPSDRIAETHLRLFIPHQPQRDNALARRLCPMLTDGRNTAEGAAATRNAIDCMAAMWTVSIDGVAIPLDDFVPIERRDLGMRGLVGYIPLGQRQPGRHNLALTWNADGGEDGKQRRREYRIPFWFIPQIAERVQRD